MKLSYNLHAITRRAIKLRDLYAAELVDHYARGEVLDRLAYLTAEYLKIDPDLAAVCVEHLAGDRLTWDVLFRLAWRLSSNSEHLRRGRALLPWVQQTASQWVPAQVIKLEPERTRAGKLGHRIYLRALAGFPAMEVFERLFSDRLYHFAATRWGFTRRNGDYPMQSPLELSGLRTYILIAAGTTPERPRFAQLADLTQEFTSLLKYNRKLIRARCRDSTIFPCPYQLPVSLRCYRCPLGRDRCRVAIRPVTYVCQACPGCRQEEAWFDPSSPHDVCVECVRRRALRRQIQEVS